MISIIFPTCNEADRIEQTILNYSKLLEENFPDYEMIFVCNGCKDGTERIIEKYSSKNKKISCLRFSEKLGKGKAIEHGFKISRGDIVGFIDADDSFDVNGIKTLINDIGDYDVTIASKWKNQSFFRVNQSFSRKILSRGWNSLVRLISGLNFHDTQAGAKFFKRKVLEEIGFDFSSKGFEIDVELLTKSLNANASIKELFTHSFSREKTTIEFQDIIKMFYNLINLRPRRGFHEK